MKRLKTEGIVLHRAEVTTAFDYHYLVQVDGSVKENVPVDDKGEHAIMYNGTTIAVAIIGCFAALEPAKLAVPTPMQLSATVSLLRLLNRAYGGKLWVCGHSQLGTKGTSVPEKLVWGHTCPGERFPLADVIAKSGLVPWMPPPMPMA